MEPLVVGFDLDLTLVDSRIGIAAVYREVGARTGVAIDVDAALSRLGPPLEVEFELWYPPHEVATMVSLYRSIYPRYAIEASPPLPGAAESVAAVHAVGGRVIVITGKYERNARLHLAHLGFAAHEVVGWAWAEGKVDAMLAHDVRVYVGDHPADMAAAVAAGAVAVGVPTGMHDADELTAAGADVVLDSLAEFPGWLAARRVPGPRDGGRAHDEGGRAHDDEGIPVGLPVADR